MICKNCISYRISCGLSFSLVYSTMLVKLVFLISLNSGVYLPATYQALLLCFAVLIQLVSSIPFEFYFLHLLKAQFTFLVHLLPICLGTVLFWWSLATWDNKIIIVIWYSIYSTDVFLKIIIFTRVTAECRLPLPWLRVASWFFCNQGLKNCWHGSGIEPVTLYHSSTVRHLWPLSHSNL